MLRHPELLFFVLLAGIVYQLLVGEEYPSTGIDQKTPVSYILMHLLKYSSAVNNSKLKCKYHQLTGRKGLSDLTQFHIRNRRFKYITLPVHHIV